LLGFGYRGYDKMQQNATDEGEPGKLTTLQLQVLAALLSGSTATAAAEVAGVDRTSVHRWLRHDWGFQAALNRGRRELQDGLQAHLERVAERAVQAVSDAIEAGDLRAALAVLKGLGFLGGHPAEIGGDDPGILRKESELASREAYGERIFRELTALV
jgi:hypothetical protein